jgi:hypothetical protein
MATLLSSSPVVQVTSRPFAPPRGKRSAALASRRVATRCDSSTSALEPAELAGAHAKPAVLSRRAALLAVVLGSGVGFVDAAPADAAVLSSPDDGVVLVVGATGATGRRVVAQLRAKGVAVRAGSRDIKKAQVKR